jgi:hypothetical protein
MKPTKNDDELIEEVSSGITEEELLKIRQEAIPQRHDWYQQGVWLKCRSCKLNHGSYIGTEYILIGIDEHNKPILDKIS